MCVFSSHSVVRDPPFSRIDLVSCRNLLIYLDADMQSQLIPVFHYALRPGGFLFLGSAENVTQHGDLFAALEKKQRIFQRRDHAVAPVHFPRFVPGLRISGTSLGGREEPTFAGIGLRRSVETCVIERYAPAHVVEHTGKYLEPAVGQPSRALLGMARKGLRLELRAALQEAIETRRPVLRESLAVEFDDHVQIVNLAVDLLPEHEKQPLFIVLFTDVGPLLSREELAAQGRGTPAHDASIAQLDRELRDTRERLQGTIEEYETALEEVRAAND
jgi:two-component system CheB/CheR fusion protein